MDYVLVFLLGMAVMFIPAALSLVEMLKRKGATISLEV